MYSFRTTIGPVDLAFTDRYGGVSAAPFAELNLSISGPDDESAKTRNHEVLLADFAPTDRFRPVSERSILHRRRLSSASSRNTRMEWLRDRLLRGLIARRFRARAGNRLGVAPTRRLTS